MGCFSTSALVTRTLNVVTLTPYTGYICYASAWPKFLHGQELEGPYPQSYERPTETNVHKRSCFVQNDQICTPFHCTVCRWWRIACRKQHPCSPATWRSTRRRPATANLTQLSLVLAFKKEPNRHILRNRHNTLVPSVLFSLPGERRGATRKDLSPPRNTRTPEVPSA